MKAKETSNRQQNIAAADHAQTGNGLLIQPKLTIGEVNDPMEYEADAIADQVLRMSAPPLALAPSISGENIQRKCAHCEEEEKVQRKPLISFIQRKSDLGGTTVNNNISKRIESARNGGSPLTGATKSFMESRFGADFSSVKIHTDSNAVQFSRELNAEAFTVGNNVFFNRGKYDPESHSGKHLLAHELTHTVQQRGTVARKLQRKNGVNDDPIHDPLLDRFSAETGIPRDMANVHSPEYERWIAQQNGSGEGPAKKVKALTTVTPNDIELIADLIHNAVDRWGTDEEAIYRALQRLNRQPNEISRVKNAYAKKYKTSLEAELRDEMSGKELRFALALIGIDEGKEKLIQDFPKSDEDYEKAAARLNRAMKGLGTDEEEIFAVLLPFNNDTAALDKLKKIYKEKFKEDLDEELKGELSSSEEDYANFLKGQKRFYEEEVKYILSFIKTEAVKKAETSPSIDTSGAFYTELKDRYLKDYLANPTKAEGKKATEGIGKTMEARQSGAIIEVKPDGGLWRPAENTWEQGAFLFWNRTKIPQLPAELRDLPIFANMKTLPSQLSAGTNTLIKENVSRLPILDVPFLLGKPNPGSGDINIDIMGGGKNISQLMHWATGVKYSGEDPKALRELFVAYELWHLEGWDVFGQDSLNDLISEEQGRLLGSELRKGSDGRIKSEADLLPFLNKSFSEARAWLGALLRYRRSELENWVLNKQMPLAVEHWDEDRKFDAWNNAKTIFELLASGISVEEVKKSQIVGAIIDIFSLLHEADRWERIEGKIEVTDLQKRLVQGKLNKILSLFALAEEKKGYQMSQDLGRLKAASNERNQLRK